jgi:hypothetical protein
MSLTDDIIADIRATGGRPLPAGWTYAVNLAEATLGMESAVYEVWQTPGYDGDPDEVVLLDIQRLGAELLMTDDVLRVVDQTLPMATPAHWYALMVHIATHLDAEDLSTKPPVVWADGRTRGGA